MGLDVIDERDPRLRSTTARLIYSPALEIVSSVLLRLLRPTLKSDPVEAKKYVDVLGIQVQYRYDE